MPAILSADFLWWLIAIVLMAVGLLGTVLPIIPGTSIILAAAIFHRFMVGAERGMAWWAIAGLVFLTLLSYALDFLGSYFGAKYFGASRAAKVGAVIGGIAALFAGVVTLVGFALLLVLPVAGAIVGEIIAGKRLISAGKAGWGTLLGTLGGMIGKLAIGLMMVSWWLISVRSPLQFH